MDDKNNVAITCEIDDCVYHQPIGLPPSGTCKQKEILIESDNAGGMFCINFVKKD